MVPVDQFDGRADEVEAADDATQPGRRARSTGTVRPPTTAMTHIAIQEQLDGKTADWMEPITDEQCGK